MNIKLTDKQKIKILCSDDIYSIMQRILLRENKIDRDREHFWTISLNTAKKVLNIELVSLGSINETLVEPMEVFSVPLQKRAVSIIVVHNHPSGETNPSAEDKDLTDRLIQVGKIMKVPVVDHLIITEKTYFSFLNNDVMAKLELSTKYVPAFELRKRYEQAAKQTGIEKGKKEEKVELARIMKEKGLEIELISEITGLSKAIINRLKTD